VSVQAIRRDAVLHVDAALADIALRSYSLEHGLFAVHPVCALPGLGIEISLERDVVIVLKSTNGHAPQNGEVPSAADEEGRYSVRWQPADQGRFPRFDGLLRIMRDGEMTRLQLDGAYDDPMSSRADMAEVELGVRLAQATARAMLDEIIATVSA
jgi:hypothetical protein